MKICALSSSSSGNSFYFETERVKFLIDAGLSGKQIRERLANIGRSPEELDGIFVSHEHRDHIRGLKVLAKRLGLTVFANRATWECLDGDTRKHLTVEFFESGDEIPFGDVVIQPFPVMHDAAEPVSFTLHWRSLKVGMAQDLGYADKLVQKNLEGSSVLLLEFNHDQEMLLTGPYPWPIKQRILSKQGHLSNTEASSMASEVAHADLKAIFLTHLSEKNNRPELARQELKRRLNALGMDHITLCMTHPKQISRPFTLKEK